MLSLGGIAPCSASDSAYCYTCLASVVCLSVCLSHSCTRLKLFDGFRCHLAGTIAGSNDTLLCYIGFLTPGKGDILGGRNLHLMLPPGEYNEEFGGLATAIPPFAQLLWSLLLNV